VPTGRSVRMSIRAMLPPLLEQTATQSGPTKQDRC
jgi:hypothetical protein